MKSAQSLAWGVLLLIASGPRALAAGDQGRCDAGCLNGLVDGTLAAFVAHDPARLPLAPNVRYTEDGPTLKLGDGLWGTASGLGTYKHYVPDVEAGQAGFFGVVLENGNPSIVGLRLGLAGRKIAEIEAIVVRKGDGGWFKPEALTAVPPVWLQTIPPPERETRPEIAATAMKYFEGLERNDGSKDIPFAADCNRLEGGVQTTNNPELDKESPFDFPTNGMSCGQPFKLGFYQFVTGVRDRRFPIVDVEHGVAMGFGFLDHNGTVRSVKLTDGRDIPISVTRPWTWELVELFKIENHQIHQIEAAYLHVPYGLKSGWGP